MSVPAKRKNMATTADGAQYNKRKRPDNYAAILAMPPPPRPSPKPATTTTTNAPPKQKVISPHARRDKWGKWTKNGPNKAIKNELADYKKPDTAAQDTKVSEKEGEADEDVKTEATVADVTTGAEVKEVSGADVKVDIEDYEGKHAEGNDYDTSDAEFLKDDKNKDDKVGNEGKFKDEDKHADWGTSDSEPGSPVDKPGTHFSTFTPMGQRKTIYKKERDVDGDKRPKKNNNKKFEARRNPVYGQTSAFPVLEEEENGDNVANEDDFEAMRYLKQVMNEASGLPITFSGPKPDGHGMYDAGDMRGFYEDGAYVARSAPIIGPVMPPDYKNTAASNSTDEDELLEDGYMEEEIFEDEDLDIEMVDAQEEYHNRMLLRFNGFRKLMSQMPSEDKRASLSQSRWVMFPTHPPKAMRLAVRQWLRFFAEEPPHPVQVAQMDSYCVLQLLDILKRKLECFKDVEENISIWMFALLARLAEVIPIYCDDASIVREMALRALMVRVTFTGEHVPELEDKVPQYYNEDKDFFDHVDADPRQGKKQQGKEMKVKAESSSDSSAVKEESVGMEDLRKALQEQKELILRKEALMKRVGDMPPWESKRVAFGLEPRDTSDSEDEEEFEPPPEQSTVPNPNANTRTTLDMILAVACDVFGQKDLSKYMEIWGEQDYERPSEEEKEELKRMEEEDSRPSLPPILSPIGSPLR